MTDSPNLCPKCGTPMKAKVEPMFFGLPHDARWVCPLHPDKCRIKELERDLKTYAGWMREVGDLLAVPVHVSPEAYHQSTVMRCRDLLARAEKAEQALAALRKAGDELEEWSLWSEKFNAEALDGKPHFSAQKGRDAWRAALAREAERKKVKE